MRGDAKTVAEANQIRRMNGVINADEWRAEDGLDPLDGDQGQVYLAPVNMTTLDRIINPPAPPPPPAPAPAGPPAKGGAPETKALDGDVEERAARAVGGRERLAASYKSVLADAAARVLRRERQDVMAGARKLLNKRDVATVDAWLTSFYSDHRDFIEQNMTPAFMSYGLGVYSEVADELDLPGASELPQATADFIRAYVGVYVMRHVGMSLGVLKKALGGATSPDEAIAALELVFDHWDAERALDIGEEEAIRAGNALTRATYVDHGVTKLRWITRGRSSCGHCGHLNGKVVGIQHNFVEADTDFEPEGTQHPIRTQSNVGHPPLHRGCKCLIARG
jgi:hypothetical protein